MGGRRRGAKVHSARFSVERTAVKNLRAWKLEDAKARFSEVVRLARQEGPQRVTYRGKDAVVVIAVEELKQLLPAERPERSLVDFLQGTALAEIDIRREPDRGRDVVR
ncbi:MAG: type II toxin-antitoxin system prevent-host-death family antitoxin [Pseudomonadota bacterium]